LTSLRPTEPYGPGRYADPGFLDRDGLQAQHSGKRPIKRIPLFPRNQIRKAWDAFDQTVACKYTADQLVEIEENFRLAAAKAGVNIPYS
jgi:hypothetical protein